MASLDSTENLDPRMSEVYQKLYFNLGVEQFQQGDYQLSINSFNQSQTHPQNKSLNAQSTYWIAESLYHQQKYTQATQQYLTFIFAPRAFLLPEFKVANYALGYAYFQNKNYPDAAQWFRKYIDYKDDFAPRKMDALLRIADSYFINKKYLLAQEYYKSAYDNRGRNVDYALYQYSITQGLLGNKTVRNESLEKLLVEFPNSTYAEASLFQLGKNYMIEGINDKALSNFNVIVHGNINNTYRKKSLENIGLIHYNTNQNEKALSIFKQVINEHPSYTESKNALDRVQTIYLEMGDIDSYEAYISSLDFMDLSKSALDSLTYNSAEDFYVDGNLEKAIPLLQKYLIKFSPPIFANRAHFNLAEAYIYREIA